MKKILFLAFGLLLACAVHAANDVGVKHDQPTVTITVPDFCADMPVMAYDNAQFISVMMFDVAAVTVEAISDQFTFHATYGCHSKQVAVPRSPFTTMQYVGRFVPPNTISRRMIRHYRNYGHNH